jgi:hypothetical protein
MGRREGHRGTAVALALVLALAASLMLGPGGCAPKGPVEAEPPGAAPAPAVAPTEWEPDALSAVMPGLVGWRATAAGGGELVGISPEGTATVVWAAPVADGGVSYTAIAVDADGPQVLCAGAEAQTGAVRSLLLLRADGRVEELAMPEGFDGVTSGTFVSGRPLAVLTHATSTEYTSQIGTFSDGGAWQPVELTGRLPDYQFVERIALVPDTDAVAVVLKTPGGPGDRDDEALVLARFEGGALTAYTEAFRDDALVGAMPLWGAEGVVYPRTPSRVGLEGVVDLVRAVWTGTAWQEEVVTEGAPLATGIETGIVAVQDPSGLYWVRQAGEGPHGAGTTLASFDVARDMIVPYSADLSDIDWFVWLRPSLD